MIDKDDDGYSTIATAQAECPAPHGKEIT